MGTDNIAEIIQNTIKYIETKEYKSYDLYDALTNPVINYLTHPFPYLRRVAIQINSKSFIDIHWTGMKKMIHTKTISDLLWYYSIKKEHQTSLIAASNPDISKINQLYSTLIDLKIPDFYAWGLNFPYTSRFINASSNTPNIYNTIYTGIAICYSLEYLNAKNRENAFKVLKGIIEFLINDMWSVDEKGQGWFQYYPGQKYPTYNVNALILYFLVFIQKRIKVLDFDLKDKIQAIINLLCKEQQTNGSWAYARSPRGRWIDGFHTGFILESLAFAKKEGINSPELDLALSKGNHFYVKNLFTNDSYVKYFSNSSKYPIEAQSYAQAIKTLSILGNWDLLKKDSLLNDVISKAIKYLYNEKGFFYFKKTKYFTFKTPYFRWSLTPMILALEHANQYMKMK